MLNAKPVLVIIIQVVGVSFAFLNIDFHGPLSKNSQEIEKAGDGFVLHSDVSSSFGLKVEVSCQDEGEPFRQTSEDDKQIGLLLSRLDLSKTEIDRFQASHNPQKAAEQLLNYYRRRRSIIHPINKNAESLHNQVEITPKDRTIADDALKHVFIGQPAYPPQFCGDDIDWNTRPVPDMEWVWQLNRMYFWDAMGRMYWHTADERYAEEWCRQLVDWTQKNPNDDDHQYAWRSIEAGIRGHRWTGLFQYFIDSPSFTPEVLIAFLNSCFDHAEYLMTQYRSGSNWGLMEAEGMAFIAITFPEFKNSEKWMTEAFGRLNNEISIQVYPDGHQRELAMGYHIGCIGWFYRTYEFAKLNNLENAFPDSYLEMIEKMCEVPMKIGLPDGTNAQFGDAWSGTPGQHSERFLSWSQMFDRDDFLYLASNGREGNVPETTAFALKESGLYSMRSGWDKDAICLILKCGPDGGGHCQPDNGTFELYAGGRNLMPDAGSYIYSGDPENRAWFRQTNVHQTMTLDGENTRYVPSLLRWAPGDSLDVLVVENVSYENLTHRRAVFFVDKRYFVIVDEAYGDAVGDVDLHFQLAPGDAVFDHESLSVSSNFEEGWNIMIKTNNQQGLKLEQEEGQVSFIYTKKEPRPAFRYRLNKDSERSVRFVTMVLPFNAESPNIEIKVVGDPEPGASQLQMEIIEEGSKKYIGYNLAN